MTESFCLYKLFEITKIINKFSCELKKKKSFSSCNQTWNKKRLKVALLLACNF